MWNLLVIKIVLHQTGSNAGFEARTKDHQRQIRCLCGRWTYDPRAARFVATRKQISEISKKK